MVSTSSPIANNGPVNRNARPVTNPTPATIVMAISAWSVAASNGCRDHDSTPTGR